MHIDHNPKKLLAFIILTYAIFIFIVIQIISWSLYYSFEKFGTQLTNSLAEKNLSIAANSVEKNFDEVKRYCQQIFVDNYIISLMYGDLSDQQKLNEITSRLTNSFSILSTNIYSIYVYNKNHDYFYCTDQTYSNFSAAFFDKEIYDIIKEARVADFTPFLRSIPDPNNLKKSIYVYSIILYDKYSDKKSSDAALVVNIKAEPLIKLLESMKYPDNSNYLILSTDGTIVGSSDKKDLFKKITNDKSMRKVLENINGSGSYMSRIGNSTFFSCYAYSPVLKWNFVSSTPYDILYSSVAKIKHTTLVINILVLALSILVSFILSRNINIPIKLLINKTISYENIKKGNFISFRRDILSNLLQKGVNFNNLSNCFKEFNINLDLNKYLILIHVRIDNASAFYETYVAKDRGLMLFSVGNILSEIIQETFQNESVESDSDFLDVLVNVDKYSSKEAHDILNKLLLKSQEEILRHLKFSVTFTVSECISDLQNLSDEYDKVVELSNTRLVRGHAAIIYTTEINLPSDEFTYPLNNEKQLFDLLLLAKLQAANAVYNDMAQTASERSYNDIIQFFTQLALSMNSFINRLNSATNSGIDFEFYRFGIFLNKAETIQEINRRFEQMFSEICDSLESSVKEDKNSELLSIVDDYIEVNYHDPNLSLNMIADHIRKSPTYLSRLYKKQSGKSIPDSINDLRLKKSMELLSSTSSKIEDICNSIGFPNEKYFYLFFKKHVGITPTEYRIRKPEARIL